MKRNSCNLIGFIIKATDGEIGKVEDFYFDDETWTIRYIVIKTGNWLFGRKVLISLDAVLNDDFSHNRFDVNMTMDQIKNSPDIDTDKPVSRQKEAMLNQHHFWENYWGSGSYGGEMGIGNSYPKKIKVTEITPGENIHLRSAVQISGYQVHARDGKIGHVKDFLIDDQTWQLLSVIIETHDWLGGKKVSVQIGHIQSISFLNSEIFVDASVEEINSSDKFEEAVYSQP